MAAIRTALQIGCFDNYSGSMSTLSQEYHLLDAATDEVAGGYIANSTDAITHVGFRLGSTVQAPPVYQVSLQSMDTASGKPSGTILGGGSPASATFNPTGWTTYSYRWIALDNPYTPSFGEIIIPVVRYSSGTIGGSNRISITWNWNQQFISDARLPGMTTVNNWSTVAKSSDQAFGIRTANSRHGIIVNTDQQTAVTAAAIGSRETLKFTLPSGFPELTCYGLRIVRGSMGTSFKAGIWGSTGAELASESIVTATIRGDDYVTCGFSNPVTITPGTAYYAGIERLANGGQMIYIELSEANDQLAYPLGTAACRSAWNGSAWTDHPTFRPLSLELLISDITGGGGASFPRIGGGGLVY
jgi:hypothetical protein